MTYEGTMSLPKNFAPMTEEEMMYVDGGAASAKTLVRNLRNLTAVWLPSALSVQLGLAGKIGMILKCGLTWAYANLVLLVGRVGAIIGGVIGCLLLGAGAYAGLRYLSKHNVF